MFFLAILVTSWSLMPDAKQNLLFRVVFSCVWFFVVCFWSVSHGTFWVKRLKALRQPRHWPPPAPPALEQLSRHWTLGACIAWAAAVTVRESRSSCIIHFLYFLLWAVATLTLGDLAPDTALTSPIRWTKRVTSNERTIFCLFVARDPFPMKPVFYGSLLNNWSWPQMIFCFRSKIV